MKIMVSAGEVSGDVHGAFLVRELKKLRADIHFFGLGSEKLRTEGVDIKFDLTKRGTIGILEALPNIFPIFSIFQKTKRLLLEEKPDLVILIDSQGFNLPLAKFCKKNKIKTVYYIAPQEWLWGTPAGVKRVAETVDLIVAIFEKEYGAYKEAGANVAYYGHPLVDIVTSRASRVDGQICICPGSRTHELKTLFPILIEASKLILKEMPDAHFIIPAASKEIYKQLTHYALPVTNYELINGKAYDALASSSLALCTSGTINLEASILGVPNIMVYKLSRLTYWIGKYILKIDKRIKYFSMPNILLEQKVVPELIMGDATPEKIAAESLEIIHNIGQQNNMRRSFEKLRQQLGQPGVIAQCAQKILSFSS